MRIFPRKSSQSLRLLMAIPASVPSTAVVCVNGILSPDMKTAWFEEAVEWGNTNTKMQWSFYHYDADALLTGFWQNQHADELAVIIRKIKDSGIKKVILLGHSNAAGIIALMLVRNNDINVDDIWLCAAADYEDFGDGWFNNGWNTHFVDSRLSHLVLGISANDGVLGVFQIFTPFFWFKTLGLNGPKNQKPLTVHCKFAALAPTAPILVGHDDNKTHLTWMQDDVWQLLGKIYD